MMDEKTSGVDFGLAAKNLMKSRRHIALALPSIERITEKAGRKLTNDELSSVDYCTCKGIEAQLDWDMLISCAVEEALK